MQFLLSPLMKGLVGGRVGGWHSPDHATVTRYTTTLNPAGGMYYSVPRTVIPANTDFEWGFELSPNAGLFHVFGDSTNADAPGSPLARRLAKNSDFEWLGSGFNSNGVVGSAWQSDGKLHKLIFRRVGSLVSILIDGVLDISANYTGEVSFDRIGGKYGGTTSLPTFSGSVFSSKLTVPSNTALNHDYRFDDNDGVLVDYSGNNANGASVNVTAADRELMTFDVTRNAWVGGELWIENSVVTTGGNPWIINGDGSYTRNPGAAFGQLFLNNPPIIGGAKYIVSFNVTQVTGVLRVLTRNASGVNAQGSALAVGFFEFKVTAENNFNGYIWFDTVSAGNSATINTVSLKLIIEVA
ncbi:hypothetical protein [Pseudoalteromonas phage vB_PtuP_Slicky01]|nr:hypothetical protein [Pseudoalteromonas phage vB_PtuP_Slicky01]